MSFPVSARTTGTLITATIWNSDLKDNINGLYGGALSITAQSSNDFLYATTATQMGRVAAVASKYPRLNSGGTAWEMAIPTAGKHELFIPAAAMRPLTSGGCGLHEDAVSTNAITGMPFDPTSSEGAYFWVMLPKAWNRGTITAKFVTFNKAGGSGNFVLSLAGSACSNDDAISAALGTAQQVTDGALTAYDVQVSDATAAITIAGTPAVGDYCLFVVKRLPADAADTYGSDIYLSGIQLAITTTTENDD